MDVLPCILQCTAGARGGAWCVVHTHILACSAYMRCGWCSTGMMDYPLLQTCHMSCHGLGTIYLLDIHDGHIVHGRMWTMWYLNTPSQGTGVHALPAPLWCGV
jgi:hypothetical protein